MAIQDLATVTGIAAATNIIIALLKALTGLTGRGTQAAAVGVAITIAVAARLSGVGAEVLWLETVLNGIVAAATAIGIHQGVAYKKTVS